MKITHGLGGPKGMLILIVISVAGAVGILGVWLFRESIEAPPPAAAELSPDEVLRLAGEARGPMPEVPYVAKDLARVASFGAAQLANGQWRGLPSGTVLQVARTTVEGNDLWVSGIVQGGTSRDSVRIHASFLERYAPVPLGNTVELSDVRLVHVAETPAPKITVTGWLRNISSQTLSQCTVVCTFQDSGGARLDRQQARDKVLRPLEFVRFEIPPAVTEKPFSEITLEISHATPDGLRDYLPAVVIPRSTSQRTQ
jgi:hypothetical protein